MQEHIKLADSSCSFFLSISQLVIGPSHMTQPAYSLDITACCRDIESNLVHLEPGKEASGWQTEREWMHKKTTCFI